MITVVDYGLGNIRAFENIFRALGITVQSARNAEELAKANKIILPGVGAFDWAIQSLHQSGMTTVLNKLVLEERIPVLGVCVGMQIMANSSEEGHLSGLGWIDAEVKKFDISLLNQRPHLPHMGWNDVRPEKSCSLFRDIEDPRYYFLHSYYLKPNNPKDVAAYSTYGVEFASAIASQNIFATQFHPEKSHKWGAQLLKNFEELC